LLDVGAAGGGGRGRRLIAAPREVTAAVGVGRGADAEELWRRYLTDLAAAVLGDPEGRSPVTRHAAQPRAVG
jgi:hypothetical protein